jgi:sulfate adenylyltransferase (ADP) / ATP adenylyltransferase
MTTNFSPNIIKLKYLKCLESNFLNFYQSRKASIKVVEGSSPFEVRYCPGLVAKKAEVSVNRAVLAVEASKPRNPFLPFDQNLLVSELNSSYVLIFNKFCVVPEHLLIITRDFVEQGAEYSKEDFDAVGEVLNNLKDLKPLAFYNSGPDAGASQAHRHFQIIPTEAIPIEEHINTIDIFNEPFMIPLYSSFIHGCIRRPKLSDDSSNIWHFEAYQKLKNFCLKYSAYNLLWTQDWMLLVPRRKEFTDDEINSMNAMAFAGYFLVMDERHLQQFDVINCLEQVTFKLSHQ